LIGSAVHLQYPSRSRQTLGLLLEAILMIRKRTLLSVVLPTALLFLLASFFWNLATSASEPKENAGDEKDLVTQVKELQRQVAELKTQVGELQKQRIVAAGTATWTRPELQANTTTTRVKLPADIVAGLGKDYIVLLTNHFPKGGYPYLSAYWSATTDGFDITLADVEIADGTTATYSNKNRTYLIDWVVVKK
jgi:cell division protein FtsB